MNDLRSHPNQRSCYNLMCYNFMNDGKKKKYSLPIESLPPKVKLNILKHHLPYLNLLSATHFVGLLCLSKFPNLATKSLSDSLAIKSFVRIEVNFQISFFIKISSISLENFHQFRRSGLQN